MPAPLSSRSFVLVTPDKIKFKWDYPIYCKVKKLNQRTAELEGLHDAAGHTWIVSKVSIANCVVSAQEARSRTQGPLLRQPVMVQHQEAFHFGQVLSASADQANVKLLDETVDVSTEFVFPVPPVVALLLIELAFSTSDWNAEELLEISETIVDDICGSGTAEGSTDIASIMGKFVATGSHPQSDAERTWINPSSGEEAVFPLQHVIDYAHYVDGNQDQIPASVGKSFCCPPTTRRSSRSSRRSDNLTIFDPLDDDDDNSIPEPSTASGESNRASTASRKRPAESQLCSETSSRPCTSAPVSGSLSADAQIAQLLQNHPHLAERFLHLQANVLAAPVNEPVGLPSLNQDAPSSLQPFSSTGISPQYPCLQPAEVSARSKYAFTPSALQKRIHAMATAPQHQGKSPSVFIESLINSKAVTFKPSPSVLVRAYDLSFGTRGLSIMHFAPLKTMNDKAVWILTGGVNMQNFSAAVPLPPAVQPVSIDDVLDAMSALETYSNEYFSSHLQDLVKALVIFTKRQLRDMVWQSVDLMLLVFWMNSLLEQFRVELDTGASNGCDIKLRCCFDDPDLRQILHQIQQRQIQQLQVALSQATQSRAKPKATSPRASSHSLPHDGGKRKGNRVVKSEFAIPPDVYALLPVQNEKRLCLRYISNAGCRSTSNTTCAASARAHFVPDKLDPRVREFIDEKFGGVKAEHARL